MLEFNSSNETKSNSRLALMKGSKGVSVSVSMPFNTPFGVQVSQTVKNLTNEEAEKLRDYLNNHYPIQYEDVFDVEFTEVENL